MMAIGDGIILDSQGRRMLSNTGKRATDCRETVPGVSCASCNPVYRYKTIVVSGLLLCTGCHPIGNLNKHGLWTQEPSIDPNGTYRGEYGTIGGYCAWVVEVPCTGQWKENSISDCSGTGNIFDIVALRLVLADGGANAVGLQMRWVTQSGGSTGPVAFGTGSGKGCVDTANNTYQQCNWPPLGGSNYGGAASWD